MKKIIIIIIIIIVCIILYGISFNKFSIQNNTQQDINDIYDLLQILSCCFEKNKIEYIMTGGTLLGSVRQNGLIPYDDDGDLAVLNKTPIDILSILTKLNEKYNELIFYEHTKGNMIVIKTKNSNVSIDIFFMNKNKDNIYEYLPPFNYQYPNEWFLETELYPLVDYKFGPLLLKGPNISVNFLDRTYPNWKTISSRWNSKTWIWSNDSDMNFEPVFPDINFIKRPCIF